jgi:hypothetical protein
LDTGVLDEGEKEMVLSNVGIMHRLLNGLRLSEDLGSGRA